ncbi:MAG TPA: alpha-mannosidase, partial [Candidatus Hydrogenedens sp.]|nr:alpha-mannosidase [Candidatus Hydrogenedens sp.]
MNQEKKTIYVVVNTHWDREWVYPFEETRLLLVEFMDQLIQILKNDSNFHSFTLDSQTVCLEDYLELRPEKREDIVDLVKSGKLIIGPWYSLPEEFIVNGESLVRNLLIGHRVAQSFGKVSKIGYTPFSYG